jgi:hypothetical protein
MFISFVGMVKRAPTPTNSLSHQKNTKKHARTGRVIVLFFLKKISKVAPIANSYVT